MNKAQLVAAVARELGTSKAGAERAVDCVLGVIGRNVRRGVNLVGFGSFSAVRRKPHRIRNPRTGEIMTVRAFSTVKFKAGKDLKARA